MCLQERPTDHIKEVRSDLSVAAGHLPPELSKILTAAQLRYCSTRLGKVKSLRPLLVCLSLLGQFTKCSTTS